MDTLIAALFLVIGTGIIIVSAWDLVDALASRTWQPTKGVIMVSDLQRSKDAEGVTYRAEIAYRYTVANREFVAARARFGDRSALDWSKPALRLLRKYPVGSEVTVHFDPDEPENAVLEPGVSWHVAVNIVVGVFFVLCAVLVLRQNGA